MRLSFLKLMVIGWSLFCGSQPCLAAQEASSSSHTTASSSVPVQGQALSPPPAQAQQEVFQVNCQMTGILAILETTCKAYGEKVFKALGPSIFSLFSAFALVVLIWRCCILGLLKKKFEGGEAAKLLIVFSLLGYFIKNHGTFMEYIHNPIQEVTLGITSTVVSASASGGSVKKIGDLMGIVDQAFSRIFSFAGDLMGRSWWNVAAIVNGTFIAIIFYFISCLFCFYVADFTMSLMVMVALAPLFLAGYWFEGTKAKSQGALRAVLGSGLTLILAGLSIGLILELTKQALPPAKLLSTGNTWEVLCIGVICLMFLRRASQLAAGIVGAPDSGSAAMMAASALTVARAATSIATGGIGGAIGNIQKTLKATDFVSNAGGKK